MRAVTSPWTEAEDAKLRAEYPTTGPSLFIRGKPRSAVARRAAQLGLVKARSKPYAVDDEVGSWTVIEIGLNRGGRPCVRVRCVCKETTRIADVSALRSGNQQSCRRCGIRKAKRAGLVSSQHRFVGARSSDSGRTA